MHREVTAQVKVTPIGMSREFKLKLGVNTTKNKVEIQLTEKTSLVVDREELLVALDAHPDFLK